MKQIQSARSFNQSGFAVIGVLVILVVVAAIVAVGYRDLQAKDKADANATSQADSSQAATAKTSKAAGNTLSVANKEVIPAGWRVVSDTPEYVELRNNDSKHPRSQDCSVMAYPSPDRTATTGVDQPKYAQQIETMSDNLLRAAAYGVEPLPASTMTFTVDGQPKELYAFYDRILPQKGTSGSVRYSKSSYVFRDKTIINVGQSCYSQDFSEADKALSAVVLE